MEKVFATYFMNSEGRSPSFGVEGRVASVSFLRARAQGDPPHGFTGKGKSRYPVHGRGRALHLITVWGKRGKARCALQGSRRTGMPTRESTGGTGSQPWEGGRGEKELFSQGGRPPLLEQRKGSYRRKEGERGKCRGSEQKAVWAQLILEQKKLLAIRSD